MPLHVTEAEAKKLLQLTIEGNAEEVPATTKPARKPRPKTLKLEAPDEPLEWEEQERFFLEIDSSLLEMPDLAWVFHIPNGSKMQASYVTGADGKMRRYCKEGARMLRQGVRPGYPDVGWDEARQNPAGGIYHGFRLEMKRLTKGRVEEDQEKWHKRLRSKGYYVCVARGWRQAWKELMAYRALPLPPERSH